MAEYFGIDCAKWQGTIDWGKVKSAGVQFAILKATRQNNAPEEAFKRNYSGATEAGIPIGVYRYVYAKSAAEATNEAKSVVSVIKGLDISCKVWLDMEDNSLIKLGKTTLLNIINAEKKVFEAAGYQVGIYCNQAWYNSVLPVDNIDLPFWIARYGTNNGKQQTKPVIKSNNTLWGWQYSSVGKISGISGSVDVNTAYQTPGSTKSNANTSTTATVTYATVKKGSKGATVKKLQTTLNKLGNKLTVDGKFGAKTHASVCVIQQKYGLAVDGVVGPKTWSTIMKVAN